MWLTSQGLVFGEAPCIKTMKSKRRDICKTQLPFPGDTTWRLPLARLWHRRRCGSPTITRYPASGTTGVDQITYRTILTTYYGNGDGHFGSHCTLLSKSFSRFWVVVSRNHFTYSIQVISRRIYGSPWLITTPVLTVSHPNTDTSLVKITRVFMCFCLYRRHVISRNLDKGKNTR